MNHIFEVIKNRYSVRTYELKLIEREKLEALNHFLTLNARGPFGNNVKLKIIETAENTETELKKYISYGNVKGARAFIAGSVKKGDYAMEDFGYCMEKAILMATSLGLGTVWLGGSLNRSNFASQLDMSDDEVIPAITPIGYAADKRSVMDKVVRTLSGGKNRKEFGELFSNEAFSNPLDKTMCQEYIKPLEAVRWAPSASNKQPWRILKEEDKNIFHFYMKEHPSNRAFKDIRIQNNDMGIAMSHFELAATELSLKGSWHTHNPNLSEGDLIYIASWKDSTNK